MSKRGNSEGSIYQREEDGLWVASLCYGMGKRKNLYSHTRQEVARKLTLALKAREDGLPSPSVRVTVEKFMTEWLEAVKPSVRIRTWERYDQLLNDHAFPTIGKRPLVRLEPNHLQKLYAERQESGLSSSTVAHMHRVIHHALRQAERWGYVARNVASLVSPPRSSGRKMNVLTREEITQFLEKAKGDRFEALYVLALSTGMRQGELIALRWSDLDLDSGRLEVNRTLSWPQDGKPIFSEPKTARSRRRIELPKRAIEALKRHKPRQAVERLKMGEAWEDQTLIFPDSIGGPMRPNNLVRRSFEPILTAAKLPKRRFHDLRHSAATALLSRNVHVKVVSELLGHSGIGITLDVYSHVLPDMQKEAAAVMDDLLGAGK